MLKDLLFIISGYLLGSVLFARIWCKALRGSDVTLNTKDANPGTSNAFLNGGVLCGILTLICDLSKGFLPVFLYKKFGVPTFAFPLIIAMPVVGHIFPVFFNFRGGKGIATTFGCLLGLLPKIAPVALLAFFFVFFSLAVIITDHYYRTIASYAFTGISMLFFRVDVAYIMAFAIILALTIIKMLTSKEEKGEFKVKFLWMR